MKKNDVKLYNVLLPIWLMIAFPLTWIVVLPANFLIDSAVLLLAAKLCGEKDLRGIWKRSILKVWIFGFVCDFAGAAFLLLNQFVYGEGAFFDWFYENITTPVMSNPFDGIFGVLTVLIAVLISGVCIYFADRRWAFKGAGLTAASEKRLALWLAVVTAPWTFLLPSEWFW